MLSHRQPHHIDIPTSHHIKPNVTVTETTKLSEIKDNHGTLRYKILLSNYTVDAADTLCYQVQAVDYFYNGTPLIIDTFPSEETGVLDYNIALHKYEEFVKFYSDLIRAEIREVQSPANIANPEQVVYKKADVQCCLTCKFCKREHIHTVDCQHLQPVQFVCVNPKNCIHSKNDIDRHHHGTVVINQWPKVELDCICSHYEKYDGKIRALNYVKPLENYNMALPRPEPMRHNDCED